jgi:hypothetical protein
MPCVFIEKSEAFYQFLGGFSGALFAFVFGIVSYLLAKRRERYIQHRNAVVKLQHLLSEHLDDYSQCIEIAEGMIKGLSHSPPEVPFNRFFTFKISEGLALEFANLKITNDFFSYQRRVTNMNNVFLSSINYAFTRFEDVLITSNQGLNNSNIQKAIAALREFEKQIKISETQAINLLLFVRVYLRKKRSLFDYFSKEWKVSISEQEIEEERKLFLSEIEE